MLIRQVDFPNGQRFPLRQVDCSAKSFRMRRARSYIGLLPPLVIPSMMTFLHYSPNNIVKDISNQTRKLKNHIAL